MFYKSCFNWAADVQIVIEKLVMPGILASCEILSDSRTVVICFAPFCKCSCRYFKKKIFLNTPFWLDVLLYFLWLHTIKAAEVQVPCSRVHCSRFNHKAGFCDAIIQHFHIRASGCKIIRYSCWRVYLWCALKGQLSGGKQLVLTRSYLV